MQDGVLGEGVEMVVKFGLGGVTYQRFIINGVFFVYQRVRNFTFQQDIQTNGKFFIFFLINYHFVREAIQ
jgi:hypothetical protein